MSDWVLQLVILFILILVNGVLSMAEIAIVSPRKSRLQQQADRGDETANTALKLAPKQIGLINPEKIAPRVAIPVSNLFAGLRFEVVDMDGYRVDKIIVMAISQTKVEAGKENS